MADRPEWEPPTAQGYSPVRTDHVCHRWSKMVSHGIAATSLTRQEVCLCRQTELDAGRVIKGVDGKAQ